MANSFGTDILIQAEDPKKAARFYVEHLGFTITDENPTLISMRGEHINLFIERGPALGPVLEVTVENVQEAARRLVKNGCKIVKDEPERAGFPQMLHPGSFWAHLQLDQLSFAFYRYAGCLRPCSVLTC